MANLKGCFSRKTDDWQTPKWLYNRYMIAGYMDPCPFQADFDGLELKPQFQKIFCNPPYSQISKWVDWLLECFDNGNDFVLLVPARKEFQIDFFEGRLHFNESKNGAPFPSILIKFFH